MQDPLGPRPDRDDPLNTFRHLVAIILMIVCVSMVMLGVGADQAVYHGGTIAGAREKLEGRLLATSEKELLFETAERSIAIPYSAITSIEYGQKAGRRVPLSIVTSPLAVFSWNRSHFVTIAFKDPNEREQAGVFELGKNIVRPTLKILEVRTGRQIEMQDEEACLQLKTPAECTRTQESTR